MQEINFITVGSKTFFPLICYSAKLLMKIYPNNPFYVYDWGMTSRQKNIIKSYPNLILIDWTDKLDEYGYKKVRVTRKTYGTLKESKKYEYLFTQKSQCMLDCAKKIKRNLIYLDGDAFLINKIDEIFEQDFNIGVTVRFHDKITELSKKLGIKAYINAGVMFFQLDSEGIQLFLNEWIEEIKRTAGIWLDQTALNNIIGKSSDKIFEKSNNEGFLNISNRILKVKTFPCEIYNQIELKEGFNPKKTKILHFRASQQGEVTRERIKEIIKEFRLGPFYFYILKLLPKPLKKIFKEVFNIFFLVKLLTNPFKIKNWFNEIIKPIKSTILQQNN